MDQIETSWAQMYSLNGEVDLLDWYGVLGNHDYKAPPGLQLKISDDYPHWKIRDYSYVEKMSNTLFVFFDTTPLLGSYEEDDEVKDFLPSGSISDRREKAEAFLKESFEAYKDDVDIIWRVVIGHHPVYTVGDHYAEDFDSYMNETIPALLQQLNVDVYFSGHDHNLQYLEEAGVHYFVSGAGSSIRPVAENKKIFEEATSTVHPHFHHGSQGFASVSVSNTQFLVEFIDARGSWLFKKVLEKL
eukprot:snap_masked-scaffold_14-processed-gene-2.37-mRNA-1 protein AED:0.01 eAED:0.01 QI:583/1/1/1/0.5/0.4/5/313/243